MKRTPKSPEAAINKTPFSFSNLPRSAGILLHITSLPSPYGIGDLGPQANAFADFLYRSGQTFWQVLPVNPTTASNGYSPYSALSGMGGNPLLISPDILVRDGLLTKADADKHRMKEGDKVDFEKAEQNKSALLEIAYSRYCNKPSSFQKEFAAFCRKEAYWLNDFALYSVLLQHHNNKPWYEWEEPLKQRDKKAIKQFEKDNKDEINKIKWQQWIFNKQWQELKTYCNRLNIRLFGDMPIYVGYNSSDVWSNREIFSLDKEGNQLFVAGTPPDNFNKNGQLWGMPVFNWDVLKQRHYDWWIERLKKNLQFFDLLRLDHFRGFSSYWQVKAGSTDAKQGEWIEAPGKELFTAVQKELGEMPFVAEDLGTISPDVYELRDAFQLPGMEVLSFAFGAEMVANVHIPYNHIPRCVVYTGTHDTNSILGWFACLDKQTKKNLHDYMGVKITEKNVCDLLCRMAYASVSKLAILPMQDVLELGEEARMNTPSAGKDNWAWRMTSKQLNKDIEQKLKSWCGIYDRQQQPVQESK